MAPELSMKNIAAAAACALALGSASAQLSVTSVRQPGSPLDVSIRQELDHAVDLATAWLASRQSADGAWGSETGRLWRTSVALLALSARPAAHSDAIARAALWLDRQAPGADADSRERAWRAAALLAAVPESDGRAVLAKRLLEEPPSLLCSTNAAGYCQSELWDDVRRLAGLAPEPRSGAHDAYRLAELSKNSSRLSTPAPYCRWGDIRLINRAGGGQLLRDGAAVDWRRDVAQALINAQRRDPAGGGCWPRPSDDDTLFMTAFAVLDLMEL